MYHGKIQFTVYLYRWYVTDPHIYTDTCCIALSKQGHYKFQNIEQSFKVKKKSKLKKQTLEKIHADLQLLFCKRKKSQPNLKLATKKKNSSDLVPTL